MSARTAPLLLLGYVLVGLITFGVAWNVDHEPGRDFITEPEVNTIRSMVSAIAWPLYLSVKGFSVLRSAKDERTRAAVQALQAQLAEERVKWHQRQEAILAEISKQALTFDGVSE